MCEGEGNVQSLYREEEKKGPQLEGRVACAAGRDDPDWGLN